MYLGSALKSQHLTRPTDAEIAARRERNLRLMGHQPRPVIEEMACARCDQVFGEDDFNDRNLCPECLVEAGPEPVRDPNPAIYYCRGCTLRVRGTEFNHGAGFCEVCCEATRVKFAHLHSAVK